MISTEGKTHIKRYMAGWVPAIAESIAIGIGNTAESVNDAKLVFEVDRVDIVLTSYDFINNRLVFKAPLPEGLAGTVYEVALYSMAANNVAGEFASKLLTTFDSFTEDWLDGSGSASTFVSVNSRLGADSLRHAPGASASKTDVLGEIFLDLSGHSGADRFVLAYNVGNGNTANIQLQFRTDASNYYTVSFGAQTSGYKVSEIAKSAAVATGSPDWENITEIRVITTSTAGGASQVDFDGLRIDDTDTINPDYVMVAREVLSTPFVKNEGKTQEIEFTLDVAV